MATVESDVMVANPYVKHFNYLSHKHSAWTVGTHPGVTVRDLGLRGATRGEMVAELVRRSADAAAQWEARGRGFDWLYVTNGSIDFSINGSDEITKLGPKDVAFFAPEATVRFINPASNFEAVELYEPIFTARIVDAETAKRSPKDAPIIERDTPDKRLSGGGIRPYFSYRNFNTATRTGGAVHIQEITMDEVVPLGTGFHIHTAGQFAYVLSGQAQVHMEQQVPIDLLKGDAICIAPGVAHNFLNYNLEYSVIEMTMPSKYDTVPVVIESRIPVKKTG